MEDLLDERYDTLEEAHRAALQAARAQGFAINLRKYHPSKESATKALYSCDKSRRFVSSADVDLHPSRRRNTSSQKTNCPFRFWIKLHPDKKMWAIQPPTNNTHNHPFIPAATFARYRGETLARFRSEIIRRGRDGLRPMAIAKWIATEVEGEDCPVPTHKDISNLLSTDRRRQLDGTKTSD